MQEEVYLFDCGWNFPEDAQIIQIKSKKYIKTTQNSPVDGKYFKPSDDSTTSLMAHSNQHGKSIVDI